MYIPPSCNGNRGGVVLLASPPTSVVDVISSGKMYTQFGRFIPPLYKKNLKNYWLVQVEDIVCSIPITWISRSFYLNLLYPINNCKINMFIFIT